MSNDMIIDASLILALPVYRTDESGHKHFHSIVSVMDLINATLLDPAFDYIALVS